MFEMNFYSRYRSKIKNGRRNFRGVITLIFIAGAAMILGIGAYMNYIFDLQDQINTQRLFLSSAQVGLALAESEKLNAELVEIRNINADFLAQAEEIENREVITTGLIQKIIDIMPSDVYFQAMALTQTGITVSGEAVSREVIAALVYRFKQLEEFTEIFVQTYSNNDGTFSFNLSAAFVNMAESENGGEAPAEAEGGGEEFLEYKEEVSEVLSEGEVLYAD